MQQRRLGTRTVSAIGLGAMPMSVREHTTRTVGSPPSSARSDEGVTLIDTADAYRPTRRPSDTTSRSVARALREYGAGPEDVLIASTTTRSSGTRSRNALVSACPVAEAT